METELAGRVRTLLRGPHVSEKKMFGGICFFWDGNMMVAASKRGLLVRVGKEGHDAALKKRHTRPMIQGKRSVPGYIHVADDGTRRDVDLQYWIDVARTEVETLPKKATSPSRKTSTAAKKTAAKSKAAAKVRRR